MRSNKTGKAIPNHNEEIIENTKTINKNILWWLKCGKDSIYVQFTIAKTIS